LQKSHEVQVITQNVDDLHERAGSKNIVHLHGEMLKVRSTVYEDLGYDWPDDLNIGDLCEKGAQLRPHIVWFGEMVPMLPVAAELTSRADIVIIVGTSMQVYPAAGLVGFAQPRAKVFYVDPNPGSSFELSGISHLSVFAEKATSGMKQVIREIEGLG